MRTAIQNLYRKRMGAGLALIAAAALGFACSGAVPFSAMLSAPHANGGVLRTQIAIDVAGLALNVSIAIGKEDQ